MRRLAMLEALVSLSAGACGGSSEKKTTEPATTQPATSQPATSQPPASLAGQTNDHGTQPAKDGLAVEADDFYFGPTFIQAKAGQVFTIEVENEGKVPHTFTSSALGVDEQLAPGAKTTIKLTAPASGSTEFHCRFHQGRGMQGAVVIS
jgi:plastocyanin